ncbi:hypothetical protein V6N13_129676 [Hibiscus sabdariffa]|uniref:F-box domain-containing protein n=1 Tax=Hibiscus sabdariffa TaxID=183260 RepID=A0ABR2SLV5_9ROSI
MFRDFLGIQPLLPEAEMTSTDIRRKRSENNEERPNSKRVKLEKHGVNWSDIPRDVVECIIGHLSWIDRIRIRAVCKAWSVPTRHIPVPTIDKVPWALKTFSWTDDDCRLVDPFSREYVRGKLVGGEKSELFYVERTFASYRSRCDAVHWGSAYGWILFQKPQDWGLKVKPSTMLFLYSPFTTEIIKLPELKQHLTPHVATFSLNATSPKCVIFLFASDSQSHKTYVNLCSPGDHSWRTFEFTGVGDNSVLSAVHVNGVFYCVFAGGRLVGFNVQLQEWTILADPSPSVHFSLRLKLIVIDGDVWVFDQACLKLYRFDFSEMRWVHVKELEKHALFMGRSSFSVPAVGETSDLANTIFCYDCGSTCLCYGSTCLGHKESPLYLKCVELTKCAMAWIQPPLDGLWTANDLINAV